MYIWKEMRPKMIIHYADFEPGWFSELIDHFFEFLKSCLLIYACFDTF